MRRFGSEVILVALLVGTLVGCEPGPISVPSGAQAVHVIATASEVRLNPATAHAGDVYLVLDGPVQNAELVERQPTAEGSPGPLSDQDLARLTRGDTEGTLIEDISVGCCGNVFKVVLPAGKYAIIISDPGGKSGGLVPPRSMAILQVLP
ncbi:MAG: hypothetical protein M3067_08035 [Chloroflexota bacterium]|nr:hypothetical protein [Chloroflexota bacterium]